MLRDRFGSLAGKRIAVLGLAFKPNTDDTRESPGRDIMELLVTEGAVVPMYDPIGELATVPDGATRVDSIAAAVKGADAVIIATEWQEIVAADWEQLASTMAADAVVFDGRNALNADAVKASGREYIGVGRR